MQIPNRKVLCEVALVVLGALFLTRAVLHVVLMISVKLKYGGDGFPPAQILPVAAFSAIAGLLLAYREGIAAYLFPVLGSSDIPELESIKSFQDFAIGLMGIWFAASGIVQAVIVEADEFAAPGALHEVEMLVPGPLNVQYIVHEGWISRLPYLAEILVGVFLYLFAGSLVDLWRKLRLSRRS